MVDPNAVDVSEEPVKFGDGSRANPNIDPFENPEELNQRYWSRWSWILVLIATLFSGFSLLFYGVFLAPQGEPIRQWMGIEQPVTESYRLSRAAPPRAAAPASATDSASASASSTFLAAIQPTGGSDGSDGSDHKQEANPKPDDSDYGEKTYTVQLGDILSIVFPKDWKDVCEDNKRWLKGDCNHIYPEQVLTLREGVEPTEPSDRPKVVKAKMAEPPQRRAAVARGPRTNEAGEMLYTRVGVAPLNGCGRKDHRTISEEAWEELGLSEEDRVYLRLNADLDHGPRIDLTEPEGRIDMPSGIRLEQVTFCREGKVIARGSYLTAWEDGHPAVKGQKFVLPSGLTAVWMRNCYNWVILIEEKKTPPASPPHISEEIPEEPKEPATPPPPALPPPVPTKTVEARICGHVDPSAVAGREDEFNGADSSHSLFGTLSAYCLTRNQANDGSDGFGFKLTGANWHGHVNDGMGTYHGHRYLVAPSYKLVLDEGRDYEFSVGLGRLVEKFEQGAYASKREFDLIGFTAGENDYRRRLTGETWWTETQYFGEVGIPIRRRASHNWQGHPIADTSELQRLDAVVNLGVRVYVHEDPNGETLFERLPTYLQGGLFAEMPTNASISLRAGITDPLRIVGFGAGVDKDIMHGGSFVPAAGPWVDLWKGVEFGRYSYRKQQARSAAESRGVTVKEQDGIIQSIQFSEKWLREHGYVQDPNGKWVHREGSQQ